MREPGAARFRAHTYVDPQRAAAFEAAARVLAPFGLAFLELREPDFDGTFGKTSTPPVAPAIKAAFGGPLVLNSDYDGLRAAQALAEGKADAIAFGRTFLANPDLPHRIAEGLSLTRDDQATWYVPGAKGCVDYPTAAAQAAE